MWEAIIICNCLTHCGTTCRLRTVIEYDSWILVNVITKMDPNLYRAPCSQCYPELNNTYRSITNTIITIYMYICRHQLLWTPSGSLNGKLSHALNNLVLLWTYHIIYEKLVIKQKRTNGWIYLLKMGINSICRYIHGLGGVHVGISPSNYIIYRFCSVEITTF